MVATKQEVSLDYLGWFRPVEDNLSCFDGMILDHCLVQLQLIIFMAFECDVKLPPGLKVTNGLMSLHKLNLLPYKDKDKS